MLSVGYTNQRMLKFFGRHRVASIAVGHVVVASVLGMILLSTAIGTTLFGAFAQSPCSVNDQTYMVVSGDTLSAIAGRYHTSWQRLASYNHIANANIIYINQHVCIPGVATVNNGGITTHPFGGTVPSRGMGDPFPYGQCTWYASQRFFQLHGVFVPWTMNANAWQWTARAYDFGWKVSSYPSVGAIVDLQPWVQGAYNYGHVAVVERVLGNGHVIASNMNWGVYYWQVTYVEFAPGPGVTFISY